ncbi:helix-turn-helix transcriptional regulator [Chryseobacterium pennipullorum]|nr:helix-turn-helix domain-containing protein [Chryseobacterium pennipullorum]
MRNSSKNGLVFRSEDIKIVMQEDSYSGRSSRSHMIEGKSSFNLLFLLSPHIHLAAHNCERQFSFEKNQYILHYSPEEQVAELWTDSKEILQYLQIQINYQYIFNLINPEENLESADILENMIHNNFIFLYNQTPPTMTVEMHMILKEIMTYSRKGVLQKLFVEAEIIKLLILIFEQFNEKNTSHPTDRTPEIIRQLVDENYHRNISAEEIGKQIGINQNTVRKEFKAQYQTTISEYASELRMLKAKKMIINSDIMIKEIAIECGYEYLQNFTRAFKKKFGISPDQLRRQ